MNDVAILSPDEPVAQYAVVPALSPAPIFIDGLSTTLSYVILAVKQADVYNCVCLRNNGTFKFYPNYEFWGLTRQMLHDLGLRSTYDRGPYQGVHNTTSENVMAVLHILRGQRATSVVPDHLIAGVFETSGEDRQNCRKVHPAVRGQRARVTDLPDIETANARVGWDRTLLLGWNGVTEDESLRSEYEQRKPFRLAFSGY